MSTRKAANDVKSDPHFWAVDFSGVLDFRRVLGPFETQAEATAAADSDERDKFALRDNEPQPWLDSWFLAIPGDTLAEGPFLYERNARQEAKRNIKEMGYPKEEPWFVGRVRSIHKNMVVLCRNGETPAEAKARKKEFKDGFEKAIRESNAYWAERGVVLSE